MCASKEVVTNFSTGRIGLFFILGIIFGGFPVEVTGQPEDAGVLIGTILGTPSQHGVTGTVYAVDEDHLFVRGFNYDGQAPAAYFWVGKSDQISKKCSESKPTGGTRVADPGRILKRVDGISVLLTLPSDHKINKGIKYLSVWCEFADADFGHVTIPGTITFKEVNLTALEQEAAASSDSFEKPSPVVECPGPTGPGPVTPGPATQGPGGDSGNSSDPNQSPALRARIPTYFVLTTLPVFLAGLRI